MTLAAARDSRPNLRPVNIWDAEHVVDEASARALLGAQFPQLDLRTIELVGVGWDNTVYAVDEVWVVRFPRRQMAADMFDREVALLPRLAPLLPLAVPVPELIGVPAHGFPWPFWGGRLVPGVELAEAGLPEDARVGLARQVAGFLRALHQPQVASMLGEGLPTDPMKRGDPAVRGAKTLETLDRLVAHGVVDRRSPVGRAVDELLAEAASLGAADGERVLVHGDLHLRHLLVDRGGQASGVIDWGDACLADPSVDLSLGYAVFSGAAREAFFEAYAGDVDEARELRARVLAVNLCCALAEYAHTEEEPRLLAESLAGIARSVAQGAEGPIIPEASGEVVVDPQS